MQEWLFDSNLFASQPVGAAFKTEYKDDQGIIEARVVNLENSLLVKIAGFMTLEDSCARCGRPTTATVKLENNYEYDYKGGEDTHRIRRDGKLNLHEIAIEEIELKRPLLTYCEECSHK